MNDFKKIIYSVAMMSGTIIGVGFFSLPYIASKTGILVMLGYFFILGFLVFLIHMIFAEISLHAPDFKRLPGFAKIYLGEWGKRTAFFSMIIGSIGSILAYIIVGGEFLQELLSPVFGGSNDLYTIIYFGLGAVAIYFGVKIISKIELWGLVIFLIISFVILFKSIPFIKITNFSIENDFSNFFLPYGPILFSLWGASLIPEIEEMLGGGKRLLKKIILASILISAFIYLLFTFMVLGLTGEETSESALAGLGRVLGPRIMILGFLFGFLATFTSFITIGLTLKKIFTYDLKINENISGAITCLVPLALFLIGIKSFISVISFIGGIMLGIEGILILLIYKKINPNHIWTYSLVSVFFIGIIYQIIYFTR